MVKKEDFSQSYDSDSSLSSSSSNASNSSSTAANAAASHTSQNSTKNTNNRYTFSNLLTNSGNSTNQPTSSTFQPQQQHQQSIKSYYPNQSLVTSTSSNSANLQTFAPSSGMQNLTSQLVIAAAAANNPSLDVSQVYLQNDLANAYKLPAAAVHLFNQAAAAQHQHQQQQHQQQQHQHHQQQHLHQLSSASSSSSGSSKDGMKESSSSSKHHGGHHDSGRTNGDGDVVVGHETVRKREMRLLKNRYSNFFVAFPRRESFMEHFQMFFMIWLRNLFVC
jgi:hypothetical protein